MNRTACPSARQLGLTQQRPSVSWRRRGAGVGLGVVVFEAVGEGGTGEAIGGTVGVAAPATTPVDVVGTTASAPTLVAVATGGVATPFAAGPDDAPVVAEPQAASAATRQSSTKAR